MFRRFFSLMLAPPLLMAVSCRCFAAEAFFAIDTLTFDRCFFAADRYTIALLTRRCEAPYCRYFGAFTMRDAPRCRAERDSRAMLRQRRLRAERAVPISRHFARFIA